MPNKFIWLILLSIAFNQSFAQQKKEEQVVTTSYIDSLYKTAYKYELDGLMDSVIFMANQCIILSIKNNYEKGILQGKKILADCKEVEGKLEEAIQEEKVIFSSAQKKGYNDLAAAIAFEIAYTYYCRDNNTELKDALYWADKALLLNVGPDSLQLAADVYNLKGILAEFTNSNTNVAQATKYYMIAYDNYLKAGKKERSAKVLTNISGVLFDAGMYNAADYYATKVIKDLKNSAWPTTIANAIIFKTSIAIISNNHDSIRYYKTLEDEFALKYPGNKRFLWNSMFHTALILEKQNDFLTANKHFLYCFSDTALAPASDQIVSAGLHLVFNCLALNDTANVKQILDNVKEKIESIEQKNLSQQLLERIKYNYRQLCLAYKLYKASSDHTWLPQFREVVFELPEKVLLNQGQNKASEIFGFDENFARADYQLVQERAKAQETELELKQKNLNNLKIFVIVAAAFILLLLLFFLRIRTLARKLEKSNVQLKQSNNYLQIYDRAISHDIASPLALINDCAKVLQNDHMQPKVKEILKLSILTESEKALRQVRSLLRIGIDTQHEIIDSQTKIEEILFDAAANAGINKNSIHFNRSFSLPPLAIDEDALREVFQLLLHNAAKHSGKNGSLQLTIEGKHNTNEKFGYITITDNGIGMNTDALEKMFKEKFSAGKNPGNGIGLIICKTIMEKYGGAISCQSKPGEGTTFVLKFAAQKIPINLN